MSLRAQGKVCAAHGAQQETVRGQAHEGPADGVPPPGGGDCAGDGAGKGDGATAVQRRRQNADPQSLLMICVSYKTRLHEVYTENIDAPLATWEGNGLRDGMLTLVMERKGQRYGMEGLWV
jgi:hypothetical protein